jgi:hypothetical protein
LLFAKTKRTARRTKVRCGEKNTGATRAGKPDVLEKQGKNRPRTPGVRVAASSEVDMGRGGALCLAVTTPRRRAKARTTERRDKKKSTEGTVHGRVTERG